MPFAEQERKVDTHAKQLVSSMPRGTAPRLNDVIYGDSYPNVLLYAKDNFIRNKAEQFWCSKVVDKRINDPRIAAMA